MSIDKTDLWQELARLADEAKPLIRQYQEHIEPEFAVEQEIARMREIIARQTRPFKLGIVGEFRAGKSSIINALTEKKIAYVDDMEATASLNRYQYGEQESATILYLDGRHEKLTPSEVNDQLEKRRHDTSWLSTIDFVSMSCPSRWLKKMEIWDTPGLGGSAFNATVSKRFIKEVDAVIWVFDCNYLGQSSLTEMLYELRDRGKKVLAVVNKCEERTEDQLPRVMQRVNDSYSSVTFQQIIPFSALMAEEFRQGVSESSFDGDLPPDGNIEELRRALDQEILNDPGQVSARAAAGDLRSLVVSNADRAHRNRLGARRKLRLLDDQVKQSEEEIQNTLNRLTEEFSDELVIAIREHYVDEAKRRFSKAPLDQLKDQGWVKDQLNKVNALGMSDLAKKFMKSREERMVAAVKGIVSDRTDNLYQNLLPNEIGQYFSNVASTGFDGFSSEEEASGSSIGKAIFVGAGVAVAALTIPLALLVTIVGAAVTAAAYFWNSLSGSLTIHAERDLQEKMLNNITTSIEKEVERCRPELKKSVGTVMNATQANIGNIVRTSVESRILGKTPRSEVEAVAEYGASIYTDLMKVGNEISRIAGLKSQDKATILRTSAVIQESERGRLLEIVQAILAESLDGIQITDGELNERALQFLSSVCSSTASIGIVAWQQPAARGIAEVFSEALHKLEADRVGSVSVICPTLLNPLAPDIRPSHCWFFTLNGAYEFDATLSELINPSRTINFTSHNDDGALQTEKFQRWWDDKVNDYQAVRVN